MNTRAFITGVSGPELNAAEREFIRSERPWGFILFKRNIETPAQVSLLVRELRESINDPEAPVLVDQEGGRVQRFGPPHWPIYPPGAVFGTLYDIEPSLGLSAARLSARLIAADLTETGVTVDCLPLADVPVPGADDVIGDPAWPEVVSRVVIVVARVIAVTIAIGIDWIGTSQFLRDNRGGYQQGCCGGEDLQSVHRILLVGDSRKPKTRKPHSMFLSSTRCEKGGCR